MQFLASLAFSLLMIVMAPLAASAQWDVEVLAKPSLIGRYFRPSNPDFQTPQLFEAVTNDLILVSPLSASVSHVKEDAITGHLKELSISVLLEVEVPEEVSPEDIVLLNPNSHSRAQVFGPNSKGETKRVLKFELARLGKKIKGSSKKMKTEIVKFTFPLIKGDEEFAADEIVQLHFEVLGKVQRGTVRLNDRYSWFLSLDRDHARLKWNQVLKPYNPFDTDDDNDLGGAGGCEMYLK